MASKQGIKARFGIKNLHSQEEQIEFLQMDLERKSKVLNNVCSELREYLKRFNAGVSPNTFRTNSIGIFMKRAKRMIFISQVDRQLRHLNFYQDFSIVRV